MNRCRTCLIPDTRPDTAFVDGECSACISYANRQNIDWEARQKDLIALLERHDGRCIVPSSGGKDSTWQVLKLLELGARPLVVTATTCMLTEIGRRNIDNLARYADTVEVSPNKTVRAKLNRIGLEVVGDISWPEHVAIFTTPFKVAKQTGINLIFYGENPQAEYGGPMGTDQARIMTRRWVSEFGGFLGLRPSDCVGMHGITERDMDHYMPPEDIGYVEAHFLGAYYPWDSHRNADVAARAGMVQTLPSTANWWAHENLDNAMTGLHDFMMFRKYGYGRACAQLSVDIRAGRIDRDQALRLCRQRDGRFPTTYMGYTFGEVCERIGMRPEQVHACIDHFTNWRIFDRSESRDVVLAGAA